MKRCPVPAMAFEAVRKAYAGLYYPALPYLAHLQRKRIVAGKEEAARVGERRGVASRPRPDGDVIWIHAASVGEAQSILPLIDAMLRRWPNLSFVVTTVTVTSAKIMADRLPGRSVHQYAPLDHGPWIRRFLDHWRPTAVLWVESELWPSTLHAIKDRRCPLLLLNGRVSSRSYRRWRHCKWIVRNILTYFDVCMAQSAADAERFEGLGAENVVSAGNLKLAAAPLPANSELLKELSAMTGDRPRWLLSSSHPGDDELALSTHAELRERFPDLLTVIVPRHPHRGGPIADLCRSRNLVPRRHSLGELPDGGSDIYIADTIGELGLFYRLCPIVVMGKSLLPPGGGQNPYEPARMGCAVVMGPYMDNFSDLARALADAGAAIQLRHADHLTVQLSTLIGAPDEVRAHAARASTFCDDMQIIVEETVDIVAEHIAPLRAR